MKFHKYHALGNDYIVLGPCSVDERTPDVVQAICQRTTGVGADGVLIGPLSQNPFKVVIYNADGSVAEKSGNGLRIFARYLYDSGLWSDSQYTLSSDGEVVKGVRISDEMFGIDLGHPDFRLYAGKPGGSGGTFPMTLRLADGTSFEVHCVSLGNPHCVVFDTGLSEDEFTRIAPQIERHPMFHRRTNVQFLHVASRRNIRIRIWERGSGYTKSSGTSSCAAAAVARRLGLIDDRVDVQMPGGAVTVTFDNDGAAFLTGPVAAVASGEVAREWLSASKARGTRAERQTA